MSPAWLPLVLMLAPPSPKEEILWQKLEARLAAMDHDFAGVMGVAVVDLATGRRLELHANDVFPTASSIKIAVLAELARQGRWEDLYVVDKRDLVDESVVLEYLTPGVSRVTNRDLAVFMTVESDNGATNVLIDRVGMENVNATLDKLGLRETRLRRRMIDLAAARAGRENTSTPAEMTRLLEVLYRGQLPGAAQALEILKRPKRQFFPAGLPPGTVCANKPGWLEGVVTDSAIIYAPGRPFLLSVMTTYGQDEPAARKLLAEIAALAWRHFETLGAASEYGRRLPR